MNEHFKYYYPWLEHGTMMLMSSNKEEWREGIINYYFLIKVEHPYKKRLAEVLGMKIIEYLKWINIELTPIEFYGLHVIWSYLRDKKIIELELEELYLNTLLNIQQRFLEESISYLMGDERYLDEISQQLNYELQIIDKELSHRKKTISEVSRRKLVNLSNFKKRLDYFKKLEKRKMDILEWFEVKYTKLIDNFTLIYMIEEALWSNYYEGAYHEKIAEKHNIFKHNSINNIRETLFQWIMLYYEGDSA